MTAERLAEIREEIEEMDWWESCLGEESSKELLAVIDEQAKRIAELEAFLASWREAGE